MAKNKNAAIVSLVVLLTFGGVLVMTLTRALPPGSETVLNVMLGTLASMATQVVNYWVGSSAGSAGKQADMLEMAKLAATKPGATQP